MANTSIEKLKLLLNEYPKPIDTNMLSYGTAGFRARAEKLPWIMIRIGLLASIRSKVKRGLRFHLIT